MVGLRDLKGFEGLGAYGFRVYGVWGLRSGRVTGRTGHGLHYLGFRV